MLEVGLELCVTQIALGLDGTRQMLRSRQPSPMLLIFLLLVNEEAVLAH